ncbi:MAG: hypothetical protein NC218_02865 [Acetobacter sp.]|nr:hypothetical protein [Acetobacter sp.]
MRKTKPRVKVKEIRNFSLPVVLKSSAKFVLLFRRTFLLWCLANFAFLYIFKLIPNGWTNSLSILWLVAYYVYWCIFIRYVQQHPPYFSLVRIFNGLIPASKIMFINISIYLLVVIIPYIPLFMGFRDKYLEFFERYMEILQSYDSLPGKTLFYILMLLLSPYTISRPYLAWISSLIGKNRSIIDAYKKTHRNYWNFVLCASVMSLLFMISYYIDTIYHINTLIYLMSVFPVYFNIVFIGIYKVFYKRKPKIKLTLS